MSLYELGTFAGGALQEKFLQAMDQVTSNIADPNTSPKVKRKVIMTITLAPTEERDIVPVTVDVKTTLAPAAAVGTAIIMDVDRDGKAVSAEVSKPVPSKDQMYYDNDGVVTDITAAFNKRMEA